MDEPGIATVPDEVRVSFEPIVNTLRQARHELAGVEDVVTIRPGYKYPPGAEPVPAIVVAVTPGTAPVRADALEQKFRQPFTVIDATVEEQIVAQTAQPVSFG